jgi:DNA-binding transcriptional LysR family regulator
MDIQDMRIFARVAALQNLSAVGIEMGLTPGTISKRIQALEDELTVRLFDRTTRSIRITEEGRTFLAHVERILGELEAAQAAVADKAKTPKGTIRLLAPSILARNFIAPAVMKFLETWPEVDIQMDISDLDVRIQEDGYDLVLRFGKPVDSSIIMKRLVNDRQIVVAAPSYIEKHGAPKSPDDIINHKCLALSDSWQWTFTKNGEPGVSQRVATRLKSDNGVLIAMAAMRGHGLLCTSELYVRDELKRGGLVRVLPDYYVAGKDDLYALYPSNKHMMPRLRVFLDFLAEHFRNIRPGAAAETAPMLVHDVFDAHRHQERQLAAVAARR